MCRSDSDFHRLDNVTATTTTTLPNDTDSDSTGDKEIIPSKYVDNSESQHSSDDKPSERHRRESNDATDKIRKRRSQCEFNSKFNVNAREFVLFQVKM